VIVSNDARLPNVWTRIAFSRHDRNFDAGKDGGLGLSLPIGRTCAGYAQAMIDVAQALAGRCTIWFAGFAAGKGLHRRTSSRWSPTHMEVVTKMANNLRKAGSWRVRIGCP